MCVCLGKDCMSKDDENGRIDYSEASKTMDKDFFEDFEPEQQTTTRINLYFRKRKKMNLFFLSLLQLLLLLE